MHEDTIYLTILMENLLSGLVFKKSPFGAEKNV